MTFNIVGNTLSVSGVQELSAMTSKSFRDEVRSNLTEAQTVIEIDLSETLFLDSFGIASLCDLHSTTVARSGMIRLINPTPPVQQILELTRMHRIFDIVRH